MAKHSLVIVESPAKAKTIRVRVIPDADTRFSAQGGDHRPVRACGSYRDCIFGSVVQRHVAVGLGGK